MVCMALNGGLQSETLAYVAEPLASDCASSSKASPKPVAYYCQDFAWEELQKTVESNAELSHAWSTSVGDSLAIGSRASLFDGAREQCRESVVESSLAARRESSSVKRAGHKVTGGTLPNGQAWEGFHTNHTTARFFKERRYLLEEFPELKAGRLKILEVGCGSGSTAVPLLTQNPQTLLYACDCSPTAVAHTATAVRRALGSAETARRFHGFCWDAALEPCPLGELESSQEMGGLEGVEGDGTGRGLSAGASEACSGLLEEGGVCWETNRGGGAGLRNGARRGAGEEASGVWLGQREDQGIANGDSLTVSRGSVERPGRNELSQQFLEEGENAEPDCEQQGESCRGGGAIGGGSVDGCDREKPCTESDERACTIVSPAEGKESVHTECTIASARNEQMSPPVSVAAPDEPGRLQADCSTRELELGDSEDSENGGDRVEESRLLQRGPSDSAFGQGDGFDFVTLIFTLSALHPEHMPSLLGRLHQLLRPGGAILFRDYGLYDMAMLRFPLGQKVGDRLYRRLDGTLSYFFSKDALAQLATQAGFSVVDCAYCCVNLVNKRKGIQMKRVWLHARLQK